MITSAAEILPPRTASIPTFPYLARGKRTGSIYMVLGMAPSQNDDPVYYSCVILVPADGGHPVGYLSDQRGAGIEKIEGSVKVVFISE